jgi:type IV secretion system protein VirB5
MKSLKSLIPRIALCASLVFGAGSANAGIPVIDVAAILQAVMEYVSSLSEIENQLTQIESLKNQLSQAKQTYQSISGARNLGDILNNPALQNYIPSNAMSIVSSVQGQGYGGLSTTGKILRDQSMTYNCTDLDGTERTRCQGQLAAPYQQKALMQDAMQAAQGRLAQIQGLMRRVSASSDPKETQELQARLEAENAMLQHEQSQISLARGMADADERIEQSRAREAQMQQASRTGRLADFINP